MNNYGIYRLKEDKERNIEAKYVLCCLSPKVCFDQIMLEKPYKLIFTSGTLPQVEVMSLITGLKF